MSSRNPDQLRSLRKRLFGSLMLKIAIFSTVFFIAVFIFDNFFAADLGTWIADSISQWNVYYPKSPDESRAIIDEYFSDDMAGSWDVQTNPLDGSLWIRDIRIYQLLHDLWLPIAIALYALGCLIIVALTLRRSLGYFDELEKAVAHILSDRKHPVTLSPDLSVTEARLNEIREHALAAELASVVTEERKNQLIAYLAHDIRTPLTSVIGYLHLLRDESDLAEDTKARYLEVATEKAEALSSLTGELFEIARFNAKIMDLVRTTIDLHLLCLQVADELYPLARERGMTIDVNASDTFEACVDGPKLARAIGNIVRNAIAYGDANSTIEIVVDNDADERNGHDTIAITIRNHGQTIAPENLDRIFDQFFREDAARSTSRGGTGLGLAIAREIVEAHGGTLSVQSNDGLTAFRIELAVHEELLHLS